MKKSFILKIFLGGTFLGAIGYFAFCIFSVSVSGIFHPIDQSHLPRYFIAWQDVTYGYLKLGRAERAKQIYQEVLGMGWEEPHFYYGQLGFIYEQEGNFKKAEEMYLKSVESKPEHDILENLASFYRREGHTEKEKELYEKFKKEFFT